MILMIISSEAAQLLANNDSLTNVLDYVINGGIGILVFIIWWFTFRYMIRQHESAITGYHELVKEVKHEYQELIKQTKDEHADLINKYISVVKHQMKLSNYVLRILQRLETKLDQILRES